MKLTKTKLKQIIKEELANMLEEGGFKGHTDASVESFHAGEEDITGGWDERDALETFFDRLEAVVYHSAQWQSVEEGQQALQSIGEEAERLRASN